MVGIIKTWCYALVSCTAGAIITGIFCSFIEIKSDDLPTNIKCIEKGKNFDKRNDRKKGNFRPTEKRRCCVILRNQISKIRSKLYVVFSFKKNKLFLIGRFCKKSFYARYLFIRQFLAFWQKGFVFLTKKFV